MKKRTRFTHGFQQAGNSAETIMANPKTCAFFHWKTPSDRRRFADGCLRHVAVALADAVGHNGGMEMTVAEIQAAFRSADADEFAVLERTFSDDPRKGVQQALATARRRLQAEAAELERVEGLYRFEDELVAQHGGGIAVGLDEVGRGPLAGPLAVGAVVLADRTPIAGLNDSKQVRSEHRAGIAARIRQASAASTVEYVAPADIDRMGMTAALRSAFAKAVARIEDAGIVPDVILLDGNPLHLDKREVSIVKGDARCASVAAASLIAKVERDALMCDLAERYPEYGFAENKGYASAAHIEAIKRFGLCPEHRVSFCGSFLQQTLF